MSGLAQSLQRAFWAAGRVLGDDPAVHDMGKPYFDEDAGMVDASGGGIPPAFWEHFAAALTGMRRVTTNEQLAALPFLSVIREEFRKSPSGNNYGGVYERRRTSGWECIAGAYKGSPDNGPPRLPCRVLWNPEEDDRDE